MQAINLPSAVPAQQPRSAASRAPAPRRSDPRSGRARFFLGKAFTALHCKLGTVPNPRRVGTSTGPHPAPRCADLQRCHRRSGRTGTGRESPSCDRDPTRAGGLGGAPGPPGGAPPDRASRGGGSGIRRAPRGGRGGPSRVEGRPAHLIALAELQPQGDEMLHPDEAVRILVANVENLFELPQEPQQAGRLHRGR